MFMAGHVNGKARERTGGFPPKRGSIKAKIFASMAASLLHALKRIGATLAEIIHSANAAFCKYLQLWKLGDIYRLDDGIISSTEAMILRHRGKDFDYKGNHCSFPVFELFAAVANYQM